MRLVFMGTPSFAVPSLASIVSSGHEIAAVYTQPPRPSGRNYALKKSPVHVLAEEYGLTVRHPETLKEPDAKDAFAALDADVAVVVAYGLLLPKTVLAAPKLGCLNLHGSLLPRWRGAAPIQRAIMAGDRVTAAQIMQMEKGLDTGPILLSETIPIKPDDTAGSLGERMADIGADMWPRVLAALSRGGITPTPQSEEGVTYAHKIEPDDARVDWTASAASVDCHIRGLNPVPGAWTTRRLTDGEPERLKLWMSRVGTETTSSGAPGIVVASDDQGIHISCGDGGTVIITRLQRPGKAAQDHATFLRGADLPVGTRLG